MREEIEAACAWFANLLRSHNALPETQIEAFESALFAVLQYKFTDHW